MSLLTGLAEFHPVGQSQRGLLRRPRQIADAAISVCRHQRRGLGALEPRPSAAPRKIVAVSPPAGFLKIAHGFSRGFSIWLNIQVPQGRKKCSVVPDGTFY